ncbi:MAG TPA: transporter [Dissulfurispiraceae bacterium]|nr:transporter [Dissulfurispiraceae bacterium]
MKLTLLAVILLFAIAGASYAGQPLVTDDTGTLGAGKIQLESGVAIGRDKERIFSDDGAMVIRKTQTGEALMVLTYGVHDKADAVLSVPYLWYRVRHDGALAGRSDGLGDVGLDLKWRFFEQDGWSFALKPGLTLPTGDDERGFGSGRIAYRLYFITTKELEPFAFHANLGYIRNENSSDDRRNLWHASLASEAELVKNLKAVVDIGVDTNSSRSSNSSPAYVLGGLVYTITDAVSVDAGVKFGLTKPETDISYLFGLTFKF